MHKCVLLQLREGPKLHAVIGKVVFVSLYSGQPQLASCSCCVFATFEEYGTFGHVLRVLDLGLIRAGVGAGAVEDGELAVTDNVLLDEVLVALLDLDVVLVPFDGRLVVVYRAHQGHLRVRESLIPLRQHARELELDFRL